jgi:glycosyltransferase involved in cell wall biosynthesis
VDRIESKTLVKVVATLPCHNDAAFLERAVDTLREGLTSLEDDYIIVIAEDGSTDGSAELAGKLASSDPSIIHVHDDRKLGRGRALMNAWAIFDGEVYAYVDCDLATDMSFFPQMIGYIEEGYDLATGSRYVEGADTKRPFLRGITSKAYNLIIRLVFNDGIRDHQCGFKALSRDMVNHLSVESRHGDWFWDTEAIVLAKRDGFKLVEFPIVWEEKKGSRTPLKRLLNDIWIHGKGLVKLLFR